jgi:hypothetical protein
VCDDYPAAQFGVGAEPDFDELRESLAALRAPAAAGSGGGVGDAGRGETAAAASGPPGDGGSEPGGGGGGGARREPESLDSELWGGWGNMLDGPDDAPAEEPGDSDGGRPSPYSDQLGPCPAQEATAVQSRQGRAAAGFGTGRAGWTAAGVRGVAVASARPSESARAGSVNLNLKGAPAAALKLASLRSCRGDLRSAGPGPPAGAGLGNSEPVVNHTERSRSGLRERLMSVWSDGCEEE